MGRPDGRVSRRAVGDRGDACLTLRTMRPQLPRCARFRP